jgi:hypothetical protein
MANPKSSPHEVARMARPARRRLRLIETRLPPGAGHSSSRADPAARAARRRLILDTLAALTRSGQRVTAARICVSGDVLLLTGTQSAPSDDPDDDLDWVSLAGQT